MFRWRNAIVLGLIFLVVGGAYLLLQGTGDTMDVAGATFLMVLGIAMAFTFTIVLRGSREL